MKNHPDLYLSGLLTDKFFPQDFSSLKQVNPNPFPLSINEILEAFVEAEYKMIRKLTDRKIYNWIFDSYKNQEIQMVFNTGTTNFFQIESQYVINSKTELANLNRFSTYLVPQGNFLLEWESYIFEKINELPL